MQNKCSRTWCKWQLTGFYFNFLCLGGAKVKNTMTIYKIFPFPIDQINSFSTLVVCISLRNYLHKPLKPKTLKKFFFQKKMSTTKILTDLTKGQKKSKWFYQVDISSTKRTNEFYFTTMKPQVDLFSLFFWRKLKTPKRQFEIFCPLVGSITTVIV